MERPEARSDGLVDCPRCGARSSPDDAFCGECGAALELLPASAVPAPAAAAAPMAPPPMAPLLDAAPPNAAQMVPTPPGNGAGYPATLTDGVVRGEGSANETYQGQRLTYERGVESFDPLNFTFLKEMFRAYLLFSSAAWMVAIFGLPVLLVLMIASGSGAFAGVLLFLFFMGMVGLWIVFLFRPIPVPLGEWKFLVDDKGTVGNSAFEHIAWALRRRRSPIASLRIRRLSQPGQISRDYLQVRDGIFTGYVSCFAYGGDLFIGWTYWWSISPFRWFLVALGRIWQTLTMRGSQIHLLARYEGGKALREAMHAAAREGVDVASGTIVAQGAGTIGSEIPVELVSMPTSLGFADRAEAAQATA